MIFDDGDEDNIDLSEEVWRLATQKDEEVAGQNDRKVPVKDTDTEPGMNMNRFPLGQSCVSAVMLCLLNMTYLEGLMQLNVYSL